MIKAIAFDFGGVITPGLFLSHVRNLPKDHPDRIYFNGASEKWDLGQMTIEQFYDTLSHITHIPKESIDKKFYNNAKTHVKVIEIIKKLKHEYKIILFSNNFKYNVIKYFDKLNLHELFDELVISSDHNVKKPDSKFYKIMLSQTKPRNNEIVFIDDRKENVDTGNEMGIVSFVYQNPFQLVKDLKSQKINI